VELGQCTTITRKYHSFVVLVLLLKKDTDGRMVGYLTQQPTATVTHKKLPAVCLLILFNNNKNNHKKKKNNNTLNLGAHTVCLDINNVQFWSSCLISYCLHMIMYYCMTCIWISISNLKQMHQSFSSMYTNNAITL